MSDSGKTPKDPTSKPPAKAKKVPPPPGNEDDDYEDGDIATPKRDRDDEQQGL